MGIIFSLTAPHFCAENSIGGQSRLSAPGQDVGVSSSHLFPFLLAYPTRTESINHCLKPLHPAIDPNHGVPSALFLLGTSSETKNGIMWEKFPRGKTPPPPVWEFFRRNTVFF